MSHLPGKFVWFEHLSNDIARARAFYQPLFDWHVEATPVEGRTYHLLMNQHDSIGGLRQAGAGQPAQWLSYLSVDDVDRRHQAALADGASSLHTPAPLAGFGRAATLLDPTGAVFCLWRSATGDRADLDTTEPGDFCWNELITPDPDTSLAFYERLAGFSHDEIDLGEAGTYRMLRTGAVQRGGIMPSQHAAAPAQWVPYVQVADCDRSTLDARRLGADILSPPSDIPGIGRFAVFRDPLGATLAVFRGLPES